MSDRPPLTDIRILLATWFGKWLCLQGTRDSWVTDGPALGAIIADQFGMIGLMIATAGLTVVGVWAANGYIEQSGEKDPSPVVIDEVAGMWLALMPIAMTQTWQGVLAAFILFRLFDIIKPWPISWADKSVPGGLGVMLDDILAALRRQSVCLSMSKCSQNGSGWDSRWNKNLSMQQMLFCGVSQARVDGSNSGITAYGWYGRGSINRNCRLIGCR